MQSIFEHRPENLISNLNSHTSIHIASASNFTKFHTIPAKWKEKKKTLVKID